MVYCTVYDQLKLWSSRHLVGNFDGSENLKSYEICQISLALLSNGARTCSLKDKCPELLKSIGHLFWWLIPPIRHWGFWQILFYVDTLIINNLHTKEFLKLTIILYALGCRISEITKYSKPSIVKVSCEEVWSVVHVHVKTPDVQ